MSCHQVISILMGRGGSWYWCGAGELLWLMGLGSLLGSWYLHQDLNNEIQSVVWNILKKHFRLASSHVMRQKNKNRVLTKYKELSVTRIQSRGKSREMTETGEAEMRSSRDLWGENLVFLSYVQWRATRWFDKGKQYSLISVFRKFTECCELCRIRGVSGSWHNTGMIWWWLR